MSAAVMPLVSGGVMQKIDQTTIQQIGVPGPVLMENAGRAALSRVIALLRRQRETGQGGRDGVAIVAGTGNNGGDGLVVARHLLAEGIRIQVILSSSPEHLSDDAALNYGILRKTGFEPQVAIPGESLIHRLQQSDIVVDGLLGTGIKGAPRGEAAELIKQINEASRPVLALDIPSGIEADTGQAAGEAVQAVETVTFGALKVGLVLYPGAAHAGRVWVARIGIPHCVLVEQGAGLSITTFEEASSLLPPRPPDAHKGTCGRTLILGGSPGLTGAPVMAGTAALRAGCGLTTIGVPRSLVPVIAPRLMEVMYTGLEETEDSTLSPGSLAGAETLVRSADAVVAGCGASGGSGVKKLILQLLAETTVPLVLDADGLNVLAGSLDAVAARTYPTVLTPHPGEMCRVTGEPVTDIVADPIGSAGRLAAQSGAVVVLKTARTVIASREGIWVNCTGNSGLASGGTGDVLSGLIGGFLAQGISACQAARLGVFLHGLAGDLAARDLTVYGTTAGAVLDYLPRAMRLVLENAVPAWLGYRYLEAGS